MKSTGYISSLPISIVTVRSRVAGAEYAAYDDAGPTAPRPGPTLLRQDTTALRFVSRPNGSKLNIRNTSARISI